MPIDFPDKLRSTRADGLLVDANAIDGTLANSALPLNQPSGTTAGQAVIVNSAGTGWATEFLDQIPLHSQSATYTRGRIVRDANLNVYMCAVPTTTGANLHTSSTWILLNARAYLNYGSTNAYPQGQIVDVGTGANAGLYYAKGPIAANAAEPGSNTDWVKIDNAGVDVEANPSGSDGANLTRLSVGGTNYNIPVSVTGGASAGTSAVSQETLPARTNGGFAVPGALTVTPIFADSLVNPVLTGTSRTAQKITWATTADFSDSQFVKATVEEDQELTAPSVAANTMRRVISEVYAGTYYVRMTLNLDTDGTNTIQRLQPTLAFWNTDNNTVQYGETQYVRYLLGGNGEATISLEALLHFDADTEGSLVIIQRAGATGVGGNVAQNRGYYSDAGAIRVLKWNGGLSDAERQEFVDLQRKTDSIRWDRDTSHWTRASRTDWGIVTQSTITDESAGGLATAYAAGTAGFSVSLGGNGVAAIVQMPTADVAAWEHLTHLRAYRPGNPVHPTWNLTHASYKKGVSGANTYYLIDIPDGYFTLDLEVQTEHPQWIGELEPSQVLTALNEATGDIDADLLGNAAPAGSGGGGGGFELEEIGRFTLNNYLIARTVVDTSIAIPSSVATTELWAAFIGGGGSNANHNETLRFFFASQITTATTIETTESSPTSIWNTATATARDFGVIFQQYYQSLDYNVGLGRNAAGNIVFAASSALIDPAPLILYKVNSGTKGSPSKFLELIGEDEDGFQTAATADPNTDPPSVQRGSPYDTEVTFPTAVADNEVWAFCAERSSTAGQRVYSDPCFWLFPAAQLIGIDAGVAGTTFLQAQGLTAPTVGSTSSIRIGRTSNNSLLVQFGVTAIISNIRLFRVLGGGGGTTLVDDDLESVQGIAHAVERLNLKTEDIEVDIAASEEEWDPVSTSNIVRTGWLEGDASLDAYSSATWAALCTNDAAPGTIIIPAADGPQASSGLYYGYFAFVVGTGGDGPSSSNWRIAVVDANEDLAHSRYSIPLSASVLTDRGSGVFGSETLDVYTIGPTMWPANDRVVFEEQQTEVLSIWNGDYNLARLRDAITRTEGARGEEGPFLPQDAGSLETHHAAWGGSFNPLIEDDWGTTGLSYDIITPAAPTGIGFVSTGSRMRIGDDSNERGQLVFNDANGVVDPSRCLLQVALNAEEGGTHLFALMIGTNSPPQTSGSTTNRGWQLYDRGICVIYDPTSTTDSPRFVVMAAQDGVTGNDAFWGNNAARTDAGAWTVPTGVTRVSTTNSNTDALVNASLYVAPRLTESAHVGISLEQFDREMRLYWNREHIGTWTWGAARAPFRPDRAAHGSYYGIRATSHSNRTYNGATVSPHLDVVEFALSPASRRAPARDRFI